MKTDYRVVCCVVAWLCCAAVQCRKDNSDWDNSDGNGIRDFGSEYDGDDELTFLGKAYDISNDFLKQLADPEESTVECGAECVATGGTCEPLQNDQNTKQCKCPGDKVLEEKKNKCIESTVECGAECVATGGTCEPLQDDQNTKQCKCPDDTVLEKKKNKCIVENSICSTLFAACKATGGSCLSSTDGIKCSCPEGATLQEPANFCTADDAKCPNILPNCKATGGTCVSSATGIICRCPKDTTLDEAHQKCIVSDTKCAQLFPECINTGGTCSSSTGGIQCICPKDTVFNEDHKACEVGDAKCIEQFPNCKTTGGTCLSLSGTIECRCPKDTTLETTDNKCIVEDEKCLDLFPNCKSSKGSCLSSSEGIACNCPEGTTLNANENKCVVTDAKCAELFPNCKTSGGACMWVSDDIKCTCPDGTDFDKTEKKCKVGDTKCKELYPDCENSKGTCVSTAGGIKCSCPAGTIFKDTERKCVVEEAKCTQQFPNCAPSGGTCIPSTDGIECSCPVGTTLNGEEKKCIVDEEKCKELENCKATGGKCVSTPEGIKCSCPEGTTLESTNQKCIVEEAKCLAIYPNCKNTGGACLSSAEGIKCICSVDTTFSDADKKCVVSEGKCTELFPNCKSTGGSCVSSVEGIKCSCSGGSAFDDTEKNCKVCQCGEKSTGCKFEAGKKVCSCSENFEDKQGTCSECDCGSKSEKCKFDDDKKVCTCSKGYEDRDGTCAASKCTEKCGEGYEDKSIECKTIKNDEVKCECSEKSKGFDYTNKQCKDCTCGSDSEGCEYEGNKKVCLCKDGYADKDGKCTACECGEDAEGCTFDKKGKTCQCKENYADKNGTCEKCNCNDAFSKGCSFKGEDKKCDCIKDYADDKGECKMDYCQVKCGCDAGGCGGDTYCEGDKFKEGLACGCNDEPVKKFDSSMKMCRTPCKGEKDECKNGAECKGGDDVKFCKCDEGKTSGDTCAEVLDCGKGRKFENCVKEKGRCEFDLTTKEAVCKCDRGKKFDDTKNYCVDKFCVEGNCQDNSECQYDNETHTGYCKCKKGQYYNYQENLCKAPDKCLLKKKPCEENEICVDGVCKCPSPYEKDGDKCIKKFCKPNPCFTGANCSDETNSCYCEEGKFFTGSKCEEKKCILDNDYAEKCNCPRGMNRVENKCVPISGKACEKDCGYGLCVNDICRCFPGAELKNEICVLKTSFCASGKLKSGSRSQCLCEGNLKQAKDGKTCELITCDDESAKTTCAQKGATCKMTWRGTPKFDCECPEGYTMDLDRNICTDPCSLQRNIDSCLEEQKFCFNSNSKKNPLTVDCKCPPPFTNAAGCNVLDKNIYLISGIPVAKKHYEMKHGINHVLLNTDLTQSLQQTYSSNVFDYGYLYDFEVMDKEIMCSVWIRFKLNASEHLERLPYQAQQFTEGVCEDCDTSMFVWPPALPLSRKLNEVHYENLDLCSTAVKDKLCGREAGCSKTTGCYCPKGSRMLEYTFRKTADGKRMQRCEATTKSGDLDECKMGTHNCSKNSECVKIPGDFICQCKPGFWKEDNYDKEDCQDLCAKKPCVKGKCSMKKENFNCECEPGYGGSRCDLKDVNFASAKKSTVVVGAVLGSILIVGILAFLLYYRKIKKSSYSEDFMPAPSHSEMTERRPMRGIANKSYE